MARLSVTLHPLPPGQAAAAPDPSDLVHRAVVGPSCSTPHLQIDLAWTPRYAQEAISTALHGRPKTLDRVPSCNKAGVSISLSELRFSFFPFVFQISPPRRFCPTLINTSPPDRCLLPRSQGHSCANTQTRSPAVELRVELRASFFFFFFFTPLHQHAGSIIIRLCDDEEFWREKLLGPATQSSRFAKDQPTGRFTVTAARKLTGQSTSSVTTTPSYPRIQPSLSLCLSLVAAAWAQYDPTRVATCKHPWPRA